MVAQKRGMTAQLADMVEECEALESLDKAEAVAQVAKKHPKFCGDCIDHGILELERQSQRRRKRRLDVPN